MRWQMACASQTLKHFQLYCRAGTRPKLSRFIPKNNYLSGDGKSEVWQAGSLYVPSERRFAKLDQTRVLPNGRRADQREFQSEDDWRVWQRKRDEAREYPRTDWIIRMGEHNVGHRLSGVPELQLDGYCTNPFNLHRTGVQARTLYNPSPDVRDPTWRGPHGYYGYYHERLDARDPHGFRLYKQSYNDEDWLKWEQMKTAATRT